MSTLQDQLNKLPQNIRLLLIATVPAFLVFVTEEMNRPHIPSETEIESQHLFSKEELKKVGGVAGMAEQLMKSLDQPASHPQSQSQAICITGLRSGAYHYVVTMLDHLRARVEDSVNMKNADDEAYIDDDIAGSLDVIAKSLSTLDTSLNQTLAACPNDTIVANEVTQLRTFLKQHAVPLLNEVKNAAADKSTPAAR